MPKVPFYKDDDVNVSYSIEKFLLRYCCLDEKNLIALKKGALWFSDAKTFNDIYDCNLNVNFENTDEEIRGYIEKCQKMPNRKQPPTDKIYDKKYREEQTYNTLQNSIAQKGVCCLSEANINPAKEMLMWSRYAENHCGICLVFDIEKDIQYFMYPYIVKYENEYPDFNYFRKKIELPPEKSAEELFAFHFATKSDAWSYENEVRIVKDKELFHVYKGLIEFKKEALVEIRFGLKIQAEKINLIKEIIFQAGYGKIKFTKAKPKIRQFGFDYEEI